MEKTNVMRLLEQKKTAYTAHIYEADATKTVDEMADKDRQLIASWKLRISLSPIA